MVVSTFIISRPLVDVHAVEADGTYVENEDMWTLPMDWNTTDEIDSNGWSISKKGQWELTSFATPSATASTPYEGVSTVSADNYGVSNSGIGPYPYVETTQIRQNLTNNPELNWTTWYVNSGRRWRGGTIFATGDNSSYMKVSPITDATGVTAASQNPTVVFTAPKAGTYSYSELVKLIRTTDDSSPATDITIEVAVRKNGGEPLESFTLKTGATSATVEGTVDLQVDDILMFTFSLTSESTIKDSISDANRSHILELSNVVVKLEKANAELPIFFDGTSRFDVRGNVELARYQRDTEGTIEDKIFTDGIEIRYNDTQWYLTDGVTGNKLWTISKTDFTIIAAGGHHNGHIGQGKGLGSVAIFTAPYAGEFEITFSHNSNWTGSRGRGVEVFIMNEEGVRLAEDSSTADLELITASATVTLKKDEKVYIVRAPLESDEYENWSSDGTSELTIIEHDHVCSADSVTKVTGVPATCVDGILDHYTCYCGFNYSDANATERLASIVDPGIGGHDYADTYTTSETEHWYACSNGCGVDSERAAHAWANGVCSTCAYECLHTTRTTATCNAPETCTNCKVTFGEVDKSNHTSAGVYVNTGKGTHRFNRICCDDTDIAEEACTYGDDNICDKCGYDNTALENAETNKNTAFDNYLNNNDGEVTVIGPAAGALDDYAVTGNVIDGAEYKLFNIDFDDNGNMFLRHHFIIENNAKVYLNGVEITLNNVENTNIYYFDVTPVAGKYHVADAIKVVSGENEETYNVSLYSYIKVALDEDNVGQLSDKQLTLLNSLYDLNEEAREDKQLLVGMANQSKNQIEVYDIATGNMNTPVWTYKTTATTISGFKFRNYAPYGDVVLTTAGKIAEMVSYDTKEVIWRTTESSGNSHSIELLPNGVIVTGGTNATTHATAPGCTLTFFNLYGENPSECILEVYYNDAHGVLWDPEYNVLWALGTNLLTAYEVNLNDDGTISLVKDETLSVVLPDTSGHDLQPYGKDVHKLMVSTHNGIYVVDKRTRKATMIVEQSSIKGIGILPTGELVYMYPDGLLETWNTTWINRVDAEGNVTEIHSDQGRFYKLRVWDTAYQ